MSSLFLNFEFFFIHNKKLLGVTFLFGVNWLNGLGVIGIFLVFKGGSRLFWPPILKF